MALQQFMISIQPIVGKLVSVDEDGEEFIPSRTSTEINNAPAPSNNLEDVEGLRNMVEELKDSFQKSQDATAKIRREKNELLMKMSKALADIQEKDDQIARMQKDQVTKIVSLEVQSSMMVPDTVPPSPPPPPPPPPPLAPPIQQDELYPIVKRNLVKRSNSHRSSRYLHPLALNLCFPNLKSLHESSATAPSHIISPTGNSFRVTDSEHSEFFKKPAPMLVMKQFFWSKLPMDKIGNTVWNELSTSKPLDFSSDSSSSSEEEEEDLLSMPTLLELDTVELERLFKKKINNNTNRNVTDAVVVRKQNLVTLLEFNRANNIAIMLAKIRLPYPDIRDAIWNIDDHSLSTDNLMAIRQYIPTKEEIEIVKEYNGDIDLLGNAERYYRSVSNIQSNSVDYELTSFE